MTWNTMLNGFCRSGGFEKVRAFFDEIPHKDVISWNTMINCFVKYNRLEESFELFSRMQNSNIKAVQALEPFITVFGSMFTSRRIKSV